MFQPLRFPTSLCLRYIRCNSTASPSPPLLVKIRSDLKDAMRAKDKTRLNVLRAIISETSNAAKTSSPIHSDLQLLSLIRKRSASLKEAGREFAEANRDDLKENVHAEILVLGEYAEKVATTSIEEIQSAVSQAISKLQEDGGRVDMGAVLKSLFAPGGALDGKPAERGQVAKIAKQSIPHRPNLI